MKIKVVVMLFFAALLLGACNKKKLIDKQELVSQEWILSEFKSGDTLQQLPAENLVISFTDTNTVYGTAGCNRFMGRYELSAEKGFSIVSEGMTMMACPDLEFEGIYMQALSEARFASLNEGNLVIEGNEGKTVLTYHPYVENVGVATDEHDCNAAAGYMWSEVKKECIRIFETGIRMNSCLDKNATTSAFLVFSPDSLQVELFLPEDTIHPVLVYQSMQDGEYIWASENNDGYDVIKKNGTWTIRHQKNPLYVSVCETE